MPTLAGYLRKNRLTRGTVTASCRASYYPPGCASVYPVSVLRPTDRFPSKTGFTLVTACFQLAGHITRDVGRASQRHAARASSKSRHGNGPAPPIHPSIRPSIRPRFPARRDASASSRSSSASLSASPLMGKEIDCLLRCADDAVHACAHTQVPLTQSRDARSVFSYTQETRRCTAIEGSARVGA